MALSVRNCCGIHNIVAKGGAKGFYTFGLKEEQIAFALKVIDGSEAPSPIIVASILEQIGFWDKDKRSAACMNSRRGKFAMMTQASLSA